MSKVNVTLTYILFVLTCAIALFILGCAISFIFIAQFIAPCIVLFLVAVGFTFFALHYFKMINFSKGKITDEKQIKRLTKSNLAILIIMGALATIATFQALYLLLLGIYDFAFYILCGMAFSLLYVINMILFFKHQRKENSNPQ